MSYEKIKQERWQLTNQPESPKLSVGDHFYTKGEIFKIGFLSSLCGVKTNDRVFFTIDECGFVNKVFNSIDELVGHYELSDIVIKVAPIGFINGQVQFAPNMKS